MCCRCGSCRPSRAPGAQIRPEGKQHGIDKVSSAGKHAGQRRVRGEDAMARRIIDISVPLQSDIASDPPGLEPKMTYIDHKQSVAGVCAFFPGLTPADLPDGEGW